MTKRSTRPRGWLARRCVVLQGGNDEMRSKSDHLAFYKTGHNIDPAKYRKQNEKITDKLRQMFEKFTGKKVGSQFG